RPGDDTSRSYPPSITAAASSTSPSSRLSRSQSATPTPPGLSTYSRSTPRGRSARQSRSTSSSPWSSITGATVSSIRVTLSASSIDRQRAPAGRKTRHAERPTPPSQSAKTKKSGLSPLFQEFSTCSGGRQGGGIVILPPWGAPGTLDGACYL